MAGTGGTRVILATAMLALLAFLVGPVAAFTQLNSKHATKHEHRFLQSSAFCPTELAICAEDVSCSACADHFASQYTGCFEEYCENSQAEFCCALEGEEESCATDSAFADYIECWFDEQYQECPDSTHPEIGECSGASGRALSWAMSSAFSSAAVVGLFVAAFGFVV